MVHGLSDWRCSSLYFANVLQLAISPWTSLGVLCMFYSSPVTKILSLQNSVPKILISGKPGFQISINVAVVSCNTVVFFLVPGLLIAGSCIPISFPVNKKKKRLSYRHFFLLLSDHFDNVLQKLPQQQSEMLHNLLTRSVFYSIPT